MCVILLSAIVESVDAENNKLRLKIRSNKSKLNAIQYRIRQYRTAAAATAEANAAVAIISNSYTNLPDSRSIPKT